MPDPTTKQAPDTDDRPVLEFGTFALDEAAHRLTEQGVPVNIQHKPFQVLTYLAKAAPRLVTREELLQRYWSPSVNEESLTRCISTIRHCLNDRSDPPRYIETHRGVGYRLMVPVRRTPRQAVDGPQPRAQPGPADTVPARGAGHPGPRLRNRARQGGIALLASALLLAVAAWRMSANAPDSAPELIERVAVLPVATDDRDHIWLARGLSDDLRQAVSRIEGITVIAPSMIADEANASDPVGLGRRFDVEAILASRLQARGPAFSLHAELLSAEDGRIIWSSRVDPGQTASESPRVEVLARAIATRLRPALQLQAAPTRVDEQTYRLYLSGRYFVSQRTGDSLRAAIGAFDRALRREPGFADALVGAAEAWLLLPLYAAVPPIEAIPAARERAWQALEIAPEHARGHAVIGIILMQYDWDWAEAERHLRRATTLDPSDSVARQWLGELYCYQGRFEDCRRELAVALDLDPLSPVLAMLQGSPYLWAGEYAKARARYQEAARSFPDFAMGAYVLGLVAAGLEAWDEAIEAYERSLPGLGPAIVTGPLVYALARAGDRTRAAEYLRDLEALAAIRYVPPFKLATAYAGLGDEVRALEWLEEAAEQRDDRLLYLAVDPHFRALHKHPRFRALAREVGVDGALGPLTVSALSADGSG